LEKISLQQLPIHPPELLTLEKIPHSRKVVRSLRRAYPSFLRFLLCGAVLSGAIHLLRALLVLIFTPEPCM
jgi:hypothetical protein